MILIGYSMMCEQSQRQALLPGSGANGVQRAQRLVVEPHAFGGQVLPQVGDGASPGDE
jgi:hypothetical protein